MGSVGETCVCGESLPSSRRLRICRECARIKSAQSYARKKPEIAKRRKRARVALNDINGNVRRDRAYERTGLAEGWLTKTPCACGSRAGLRALISRDSGTNAVTAVAWECHSCRGGDIPTAQAMKNVPPGEAEEVLSFAAHVPAIANDDHQHRRESILSWIAALPPADRAKVEATADAMRGVVPQMLWSRSMLYKDAAIKAYLAVVGAFPA